jgi:hypothetical protein
MTDLNLAKHCDKFYHRTESFMPVFKILKEQITKTDDKILLMGLKGSLDMSLRTWSGSHATFVSKQLLQHLENTKNSKNPFELKWEDRNLLGKIEGSDKNIAVWEHTIPIKQLRESIIKCTSELELEYLIINYPGIAWITKEEDNRLTKLKFRDTRPHGFLECYKLANIDLVLEKFYK